MVQGSWPQGSIRPPIHPSSHPFIQRFGFNWVESPRHIPCLYPYFIYPAHASISYTMPIHYFIHTSYTPITYKLWAVVHHHMIGRMGDLGFLREGFPHKYQEVRPRSLSLRRLCFGGLQRSCTVGQ